MSRRYTVSAVSSGIRICIGKEKIEDVSTFHAGLSICGVKEAVLCFLTEVFYRVLKYLELIVHNSHCTVTLIGYLYNVICL